MYAITLTQPWATLSVVPLFRELVITNALVPERQRDAVKIAAGAHITIVPGAPPKLHETRSFRPHAAAVGPRVVIHAGKGDAGLRAGLVLNGRLIEPYASAVRACGYSDRDPWSDAAKADLYLYQVSGKPVADRWKPLPLGAAVGLVTFAGAEHTIRWAMLRERGDTHALDFLLGNWDPERFAWRMINPAPIHHPIACRGAQMIWKTPAEVDAAITAQRVK